MGQPAARKPDGVNCDCTRTSDPKRRLWDSQKGSTARALDLVIPSVGLPQSHHKNTKAERTAYNVLFRLGKAFCRLTGDRLRTRPGKKTSAGVVLPRRRVVSAAGHRGTMVKYALWRKRNLTQNKPRQRHRPNSLTHLRNTNPTARWARATQQRARRLTLRVQVSPISPTLAQAIRR